MILEQSALLLVANGQQALLSDSAQPRAFYEKTLDMAEGMLLKQQIVLAKFNQISTRALEQLDERMKGAEIFWDNVADQVWSKQRGKT